MKGVCSISSQEQKVKNYLITKWNYYVHWGPGWRSLKPKCYCVICVCVEGGGAALVKERGPLHSSVYKPFFCLIKKWKYSQRKFSSSETILTSYDVTVTCFFHSINWWDWASSLVYMSPLLKDVTLWCNFDSLFIDHLSTSYLNEAIVIYNAHYCAVYSIGAN